MLVAVCGLAGAGKTTAIDMLERLGVGARVYVGSFVTAEVALRELPATPQSEQRVRKELREKGGMGALASLALPTISAILEAGRIALVDAIYCIEELDLYRASFGDGVARIALDTAQEKRSHRLAIRGLRPMDPQELAARDGFELSELGLARVMATAEYKLVNDGTLDDLEDALKVLAAAFQR